MPNCFTLTRKGAASAARFCDIDDELRTHFGEPPDAEHYLYGWYDSIGLALALGHDWNKQRELFAESPNLLKVIAYLEEHYTSDAWYTPRSLM
jgi:hypothetical protein